MILFMNTIRVKNGTGDVLAKRFQNPKGVQSFPGFVRMEVLKTEGTEDYEEFKVCTTWESKGILISGSIVTLSNNPMLKTGS
ncbi:antibiotic biosynthesis monooxygenase [Paenibacillus larvae]|nr:antibiotic biosynthesis monooxygenase [Paenibacillus larvae]MDT2239302.1 antibiotic biosynthesis monooxygenase [Paenibacillus larvae]MDT2292544.1 antibiotic biosynthesis monooxygenase [Paenibacillus larvae]MDT2304227.1 antibiotic biosynthesis monooxygenase [Paenibacillus larvae]